MRSLANGYGWSTDPGPVDNIAGEKTERAVITFQEEYNSKFNGNLKIDGKIGPKTWKALFSVQRSFVEEAVEEEYGEMPLFTYGYDGSGLYPCGESFPTDAVGKDNYKSKSNRRVEMIFFEPGKSKKVTAPADKGAVKTLETVVPDKRLAMNKPVPVVPKKPEKSRAIILELVSPQIYNTSKPHKQYVNLPANGKNEGLELTIKVKTKDIKDNTTGKRVYWQVTADKNNSKRNSPKTGIMEKLGAPLVEFAAGIANIDTPFSGNESSVVLACGLAGGNRFTVEVGTDEKKFPNTSVVENWRRLWHQLTHHKSITPPSMTTPIAKLKAVFIEFLSETPNKHSKASPGKLIVGNHNQDEYHKMFSAVNGERCCHIILCDEQYDGFDSKGNNHIIDEEESFDQLSRNVQMSKPEKKLKIFNPPLQEISGTEL